MTSYDIERYIVGELDPQTRARFEEEMRASPDLARRVQERLAAQRAFAVDPRRKPFAEIERIALGKRERPVWFQRRLILVGAVAAMVAAVVVTTVTPSESVRVRGGLTVRAALSRGDQIRRVHSGTELKPGDQLSFVLEDPAGGWLTVLLEEDSGKTSVLYESNALGRISSGSHALPGSIRLDETLGEERIYFLLTADPPDLDGWLSALHTEYKARGFAHQWVPPEGVRSTVFSYRKVAP